MKKILFASLIAAFASILFTSCNNGVYDADPTTTNSNGNPLNPGGNGNGGSSFNWTGTDPMSAKINGTAWQATSISYVPGMAGLPAFVTGSGPNNSSILVYIPDNATANSVTSFNSTVTASYSANTTSGNPNDVYAASLGSGGQVQIIANDATHVTGKFYFGGKNIVGTISDITEGYFTATK